MRAKFAALCLILVWVVCCAGMVVSADYDYPKPGSYPPDNGKQSTLEFPASWGGRVPGVARIHHRAGGRNNHNRSGLHAKGKVKHVLARCFNRSCN